MEPLSVARLHLGRNKIETYMVLFLFFLPGFPVVNLQFTILEDSKKRLGK